MDSRIRTIYVDAHQPIRNVTWTCSSPTRWLGALPYALVLWPSGRMEHVLVPEYLHPLD